MGSYRPPNVHYTGAGYGGGYGMGRRRSSGGCVGCSSIIAVVIIIFIMMIVIYAMFGAMGGGSRGFANSVPASSYNREKLEGTTWTNNCVVDEIGWISEDGSISGLERQLRKFYDKTGVQPYVYLVRYNPSLRSDADKEQFASNYYENNIGNTYTFAFFYFEEANSQDVGYMYYEGGSQALGVMDAEACEIFWAITDQEWYGDNTTEDCLANMFNRTADRIMTKTATKTEVAKIVAIIVLVIVIAVVIIIIMNKRRKQERERNEETRRILETPLE